MPIREIRGLIQQAARRPLALFSIGLAAAILAAYSNHFQNGFHFDDAHTIENNAFIRSVGNIPRFFADASTFSALPSNQSYRPIVSATLAIDYWLGGGLKPFWFQATNFNWFLVQTALIALLVRHLLDARLKNPGHAWVALIAAGLYGLHPANADTVNYIIARSDILSTVGVVAGFILYIYLPRWRAWQIHLLPVALGVLAKPIAATFAPLFALYLLLFPQAAGAAGGKGRRVLDYLAAVAPAFLLCGAMSLLVWRMTPATWVAGAASARQYLITQPYVAWLYFKTFLWPVSLSADYDLAPLTGAGDPRMAEGFAFAAVLVAAGVAAAACRPTRVAGFGLLWFIVALLPTSLSPLAEVMNDHRTFFPYIGLVIALAGAGGLLIGLRAPGANRLAAGAMALLLAACAIGTYQRNKVWRDDESLWRDAVLKGPDNGRAHMNYGTAIMAKGRLAEALLEFQRARELTPYYPIVYVNLAVVESAMGNDAQAGQDFETGLRLGPQIPDCHTYYASWLLSQGRPADAEPLVRRALELSPADLMAQGLLARLDAPPPLPSPESYLALSLEKYRAGEYRESIAAAEQSLKLRPTYAEAYNNIGAAWNQLGRYDRGAAACAQALKLKPGLEIARNNLVYALRMAAKMQKAGAGGQR